MLDVVEHKYLAYLIISNSNAKLHSQIKKDIANNYSKGNTEAYPSDIHKALTLMNDYQPLKLDFPAIAPHEPAFVTSGKGGRARGSRITSLTMNGMH